MAILSYLDEMLAVS